MLGVMLDGELRRGDRLRHTRRSPLPRGGRRSARGTPQQRAAAGAQAILREFVPPPGAVRLAKRPELPGGSADHGLTATTQVDAVGYWRVSGAATALLAWEKAHISRSFSRQDVIVGPPSWNTVYSLPAVPGVLPVREMNVQFYDAGGGMTVIMADAMVSWQPPRPAVRGDPGLGRRGDDRASPGWLARGARRRSRSRRYRSCGGSRRSSTGCRCRRSGNDVPCPLGAGLTLTFRTAAGGPPVAVADGPGACGVVTLRLNGKDEPALQPPGSYRATVLKIAGLQWSLG